jgi:hypothetical protein
MMEGSGSVPLTKRSGSRRHKNLGSGSGTVVKRAVNQWKGEKREVTNVTKYIFDL